MSTDGDMFEAVVAFDALVAAQARAFRGARRNRDAMAFRFHRESECLQLQRELLARTYRPRPYRTFSILDPKPRTISAAAFRDRVVHHALCAVLEPIFERHAVAHSYACRVGKGTHRAVAQVRRWTRRFPFFLKMDVRKYFETVPHDRLKAALARVVPDPGVRWLAGVFIDHGAPGSPPGIGLPIGNLTSQHFANFYLGALDRHVLEGIGVAAYARYMDDLVFLDVSKAHLRQVEREVTSYLGGALGLAVRSEITTLAPVTEGLPFLGLRVWPGCVRLAGATRRRFIAGLRELDSLRSANRLTDDACERSMASRFGHVAHWDTGALRRSLCSGAQGTRDACDDAFRRGGAGTPRAPTG